MASVRAFMDATCEKCKGHVGWCGTAKDRPPCPQCGHEVSDESKEALEALLEAHREKARLDWIQGERDRWKPWPDGPTATQLTVYAEGRAASLAHEGDRTSPMQRMEACPYTPGKTGIGSQDDPERRMKWWYLGWDEQAAILQRLEADE